MKIGLRLALVVLGSAAAVSAAAQDVNPASCERLQSLTLTGARITAAQPVAAGAFVPPAPQNAGRFEDVPAFCRVTALASRAGDTDVKIEVWLPAPDKWTGEFQPAASGFAGGTIGYREMRTIAARGIATANTNRGHDGGGPWKPADMSAAPYHLMVEHARAIVAAFYGGPPKLTFMNECGGSGSRDALMLIQRAPADLDAAVAEGIIHRPTRHGVSQMWIYQATHASDASFIPPSKYPLLHQAALDACDAKDGVKDGVITDPPRCAFDPGVLTCKGGDAPSCLTAEQVTAARAIYSPPRDTRTNEPLYPPLVPGGELNWQPIAGEANPYVVREHVLPQRRLPGSCLDPEDPAAQLRQRSRSQRCAVRVHRRQRSAHQRLSLARRQAPDDRRLERQPAAGRQRGVLRGGGQGRRPRARPRRHPPVHGARHAPLPG